MLLDLKDVLKFFRVSRQCCQHEVETKKLPPIIAKCFWLLIVSFATEHAHSHTLSLHISTRFVYFRLHDIESVVFEDANKKCITFVLS